MELDFCSCIVLKEEGLRVGINNVREEAGMLCDVMLEDKRRCGCAVLGIYSQIVEDREWS